MGRKLYRVREGRVLAGVCGGLGRYFGVDPIIFRVLWASLACVGGTGLIAYLLFALCVPEEY